MLQQYLIAKAVIKVNLTIKLSLSAKGQAFNL